MRIGFFNLGLGNPAVRASFQGMYKSFWQALNDAGAEIEFSYSTSFPTCDVLVVPVGAGQERLSSRAMSAFNGPVIIYSPTAKSWFRQRFLTRWKHKILFVYNTDISGFSSDKYKKIGIPFLHFPFGSDPKIFRPMDIEKLYDIVFIGSSSSGVGRHEFIQPLVEKSKTEGWRLLLIGNGWEQYGFPPQMIAHGELLAVVYNLGKICVNILNRDQFTQPKRRLDSNNRLFDLAMAGCFQICNAPELVSEYFSLNEIVAIDDAKLWLDKIEYFLGHEEEMEQFKENAHHVAKLRHTWDIRARQFIEFTTSCLEEFQNQNRRHTKNLTVFRRFDRFIPPLYWIKTKGKRLGNRIF